MQHDRTRILKIQLLADDLLATSRAASERVREASKAANRATQALQQLRDEIGSSPLPGAADHFARKLAAAEAAEKLALADLDTARAHEARVTAERQEAARLAGAVRRHCLAAGIEHPAVQPGTVEFFAPALSGGRA